MSIVSIRRLEALEDRTPAKRPEPPGRSEARQWMREHLDLIAKARRGNLSEEEVAEVESVNAVIQRRLEEIRGEGVVNG